MSRANRSERSPAHAKGRPKRRAASSHLFKYQLACDPGRAEDNALKRALQESLEEQKDSSNETVVTPDKGQSSRQGKKSRVINSSTNSSDVSKTSNNTSSTSTSSESRNSPVGDTTKRTRSSLTSYITPLPTRKRAKLTTNGHGKVAPSSTNNKDKCDNGPCVLSGSPPPLMNKAIRTYSRSQRVNGLDPDKQQKNDKEIISPRSSTPIAKKQLPSNGKALPEKSKSPNTDVQSSVSRSTQTSTPVVNFSNTQINQNHHSNKDQLSPPQCPKTDDKNISNHKDTPQQEPPAVQYLKSKRESKNYAYAKMTALYVNTTKSPSCSHSKSSAKKASPASVLNNYSSNKNSASKTSPKDVNNLKGSTTGRRSPSVSPNNSTYQDKSSSSDLSRAAFKSISKLSYVPPPQRPNKTKHTIDLSTIQGQTDINVTKKRIAPGSWSLLGVPEEKIIYLRDDEPPRRMICYPAIKHVEGDVIQVRDSVLLRSGPKQTDLPYIAKVVAFWEDAETGSVMVGLFWYYRPEHIEEGRKAHHLTDEIFASRHRDIDSVECIEDKCYVLTFNEYCRWRKRLKMEQVNTTWSLADVTIPVSNEAYPRRNRIPDTSVNPELVFCCRQIYDSRMKRLIKNPLINPKYGHL